ncbi:hypothetical protein [Campylobacter mucosalis]|uniref:hypothetical protein n=1 Tax=Campylobacter mucosalis TaxID=202 RepID=UPI00146FCD6F|nr:hypothetical protein [Campylobacter mucosalis]
MLKELKTIQIIADFLKTDKKIPENLSNIDEIFTFFKELDKNKHKFNSLYILNYLYTFISSNEVNKRKTSARVFEDLIATIFNGIVADTTHRKNLTYKVSDYFINTKDKIAQNRREKADILFGNYQISVKTLMQDNAEINMGSFEKNVLFDGLNVNNYLFERKGANNAGLGSKPLLNNLFNVLIALNKNGWIDFSNKFKRMSEFIYADDLIIAIKNDKKMSLYFFSGSEIVQIFNDFCVNKDKILTLINRWEGNSLRIDRTVFLQNCTRNLEFDFSFLDDTIIKKIDNFDYTLHRKYAEFFNTENRNLKDETLQILNELFNDFSKNLKILK